MVRIERPDGDFGSGFVTRVGGRPVIVTAAHVAENADPLRVVLYDGTCGLCHKAVKWLLAHEAELELLGDTLLLGEAQLPGLCTATAPAFWRVFYAYSVLGFPVAIIAAHEGAPIPTVYNRLRLARRDLRAAILRRRAAAR